MIKETHMKALWFGLWLLLLALSSGCAVDAVFERVDRLCDAETKGKAEYRECLKREYLGLKEQIKSIKKPFTSDSDDSAEPDNDAGDDDDSEVDEG